MASDDKSNMKDVAFQVSDGVLGAAVLLALGVWGGNFLDGKLHTSPWLAVVFSLVGGGFGLWRLVQKAVLIGKNSGPDTMPPPLTDDSWAKDETRESPEVPSQQADAKPDPKAQWKPKEQPKSAFDFLDHE